MPRVPSPDYTGRDYDSGKIRAQRLVQSVFPKWTDFNRANFGNALISCLAFILDIVSFVTDFWARESLPLHARLRRSVQSHARWIGYSLSGRQAAQATQTFTLVNGAHTQDILIPSGTQFRVASDVVFIEFQLLADLTITAGNSSGTATLEHSENVDELETSTGRANQAYKMGQSPYIQDSLSVTADDGAYAKVDNFLLSEPTDQHFTIEVDDNERAIVTFGNGRKGKIPVGSINFLYKVGGGPEGNVEANTITEIQDEIVDVLGDAVEVTTTNLAAAQGGNDPETLEHAKQEAPAQLRTLNRSITREDFETTARSVSGVVDCLALTNEETGLIREGELVGYVVAKGAATASGKFKAAAPTITLLASVETAWEVTKPGPFFLRRRAVGSDGNFLNGIDVIVSVYLGETADLTVPGLGQPTNIGKKIFEALDDFFAIADENDALQTQNTFGFKIKNASGGPAAKLHWSDVFNVIRDTEGVLKMDPTSLSLDGSVGDVSLKYWEVPVLGTVLITDAETNQQLYPAV